MSYVKALKKLRALPEGERRLTREVYWNVEEQCPCVIGALIPITKAIKTSVQTPLTGIRAIYELDPDVQAAAKKLGLSELELRTLQTVNDSWYSSCEARYAGVVDWMTKKVKK